MKILNRSSIRARLKTVILIISLLSVALVFVGLFAHESIVYNDLLMDRLIAKSDIIAENTTAAIRFNDSSDAARVLGSLATQRHITSGALYTNDLRLATYRRAGWTGQIPLTPLRDGIQFHNDSVFSFRAVTLDGKRIGTVYLCMDLLGREDHFQSFFRIGILVLLGTLIIAYLVASRLEKSISEPILALAQTAKRVGETQNYSIRAEKITKDETGFLADTLNTMMGQVQERDNHLHQVNSALTEEVTERKRVEDALRQADKWLRQAHDELEERVRERTAALISVNEELQRRDLQLSAAQQLAHLGSWEWDLQTSRVIWSDELYRIYGLEQGKFSENLEGFLEMVHPEDRLTTLGHIEKAVQTGTPFAFEERIIRPDGSIRFLFSQGRSVGNEEGTRKVYGVCLDITERRLADEKFRGLLESAPDAIVIMDRSEKIILINQQTEKLFQYKRSELLGKQLKLLLPEGPGDATRNGETEGQDQTPGGTGKDKNQNLTGRRKDATLFPVEIAASPLQTEEGTVISIAIRDVTKQKHLQALLIEAERRRSVDLRRYVRSVQRVQEEERQRIARELHDDLCQRLTGMKLNVEAIADEVREEDEALHRRLMSFNDQCETAINEVRRMSVNLRPSVLDDFGLATALSLLTREFKKQHKVSVALDMGTPTRMVLDPQLEIALYRIAQEAFTNIGKYAQASQVNLSIQKGEEHITLTVSDNGKGFNPNDVQRKDPHTGLGLIGMRERTELFGGQFSIRSAVSKGTTISVTIPLNIGVRNEEDTLTHS